MKKLLFSILLLTFVLQPAAFAKPGIKRLTFARGATRLVVRDRLNDYKDSLQYVIRLRAGQRLQIGSDRRITLGVENPAGEDAMDRAANCNGTADISPTAAGDYKIYVTECRKADAWRGKFNLTIRVK